MVQEIAARFLVIVVTLLVVRGLFSVGYLLVTGFPPSFLLDSHLPYAVSGGFVAGLVLANVRFESRATWWIAAFWSSSLTILIHLLMVEFRRGLPPSLDYWVLLIGPWLIAAAAAAFVGALVFAGRMRVPGPEGD